jgi:hypothetical protein
LLSADGINAYTLVRISRKSSIQIIDKIADKIVDKIADKIADNRAGRLYRPA